MASPPVSSRPDVSRPPPLKRSWLNSTTALRGTLATVLLVAAAAPQPARALPQGGTVASGGVTISQNGTQLKVTETTQKAAINWQSYNIAPNESVIYIQPNGQAIILNRVLGGGASTINGQLTANGQVWISNPSGILFGPNAKVHVGGLIATTHDLSVDKFNAGIYQFQSDSQPAGIVENQGSITAADAGLVAFVAPGVVNHGVITARLGQIVLASGNAFTVDLYGDQKINLVVDDKVAQQVLGLDGNPLAALVSSDGKLFADGGSVRISAAAAKGLVDNVISLGGVVQARSARQENGEIILEGDGGGVQVSGTLDASGKKAGQTGGTVTVTGDAVTLTSTARIDVSGNAGGGQALIGGDFRGGNATAADYEEYAIVPAHKPVPPAETTSIASGAVIDADALATGKGGEIVAWSNDATSVQGTLTAHGGPQGGNGGFIETSGHLLDVNGISANAGAPQGKGGNWLLDPYELTVIGSGSTSATQAGSTYSSTSGGSTVLASAIFGILSGGTNVTLQTTGSAPTDGDITIAAPISWSTGATLTLDAYHSVLVDANITASGAGAGLAVIYNHGGSGGNFLTGSGSSVTLPADGSLTVNTLPYTLITGLGSIGSNLGDRYALIGDVNAAGSSIAPIGAGAPFTGIFDGLGHTIANLSVSDPSGYYDGLFSKLGSTGTIRNVGLIDESITGSHYVGGLVGSNAGTITNVYTTGSVSGTDLGAGIGGIVGLNASGASISSSYSFDAVSGGSGASNIGGLAGENDAVIINSDALGVVSGGSASFAIGGLVGNNYNASITDSYASGNVTGGNGASQIGGLVGWSSGGGIVTSYAIGSVSGGGGTSTSLGGLIGLNGSPITSSYATGHVSNGDASTSGGLVGTESGSISSSYWDKDTTGQALGCGTGSCAGATAVVSSSTPNNTTTFDAYATATYLGPDFTNSSVWYQIDGKTRPILASENAAAIVTAHQLQLINLAPASSYTIANNIDMSVVTNPSDVWKTASAFNATTSGYGFSPISSFSGVLEGLGHTIYNLIINIPTSVSPSPVGLFGTSSGTIQDINMAGVNIVGYKKVGALVGDNYGIIISANVEGSVTGQYDTGGLAGINDSSTSIRLSDFLGSVSAPLNDSWNVGGLVGLNMGAISLSFFGPSSSNATGTVQAGTNNQNLGGLVGYNNATGQIMASYAIASVTAGDGAGAPGAPGIGGLVGYNLSGLISMCYASGSVTVGANSSYIGGLVGNNSGGTIHNAYATVAVTTGASPTYVGGLAGMNSSGTIANSYWNMDAPGQTPGLPDTGGGIIPAYTAALTTNQMQNHNSYSGWDFSSGGDWYNVDGYTIPILRELPYLVITSQNASRQYGAGNPTFAFTVVDGNGINAVGKVANLSGLTTATSFSPVGSYTISPTWSSVAQGYQIAPVSSGYLSITSTPPPSNDPLSSGGGGNAAPNNPATSNPNVNNAVNQANAINQIAPSPSAILGGQGVVVSGNQGPMPVTDPGPGGQGTPTASTQTATSPSPDAGSNPTGNTTDVAGAGATTLLGPAPDAGGVGSPSPAGGNDTGGSGGSTAPGISGGGSTPLGSSSQSGAPAAGGGATAPAAAVVMVGSVPVMTTPTAPTLGQLAQTPQVQQGVQAVGTALTAIAAGSGTVHDVITNLNTGSTKLTMQEQKAVFASVPAPKLVSGLLGSSNPVDRAVGGQLKQVASGNVGLTYADVKSVLAKGGVGGTTALSYLAMFQVVHKEAMTTLFSGALTELSTNSHAADIHIGALPPPGGGHRSVSGVTATDTGGAARAAVPIDAFHRVTLPKASVERDGSGRAIIRGRLENWQPGMDVSSLSGSHALQFAALDGGTLEDYLGPSYREQVAETAPTKIDGWTGGRQVRINGRWIFVHDDGSFDIPLPAGAAVDSVKLTIVDEQGEIHEQAMAVTPGGSGGSSRPVQPRKIALLFANSAYSQNGIPDLHTPPNDAAQVSEVLHNRLGYVTQVISNPTKADMVAAIEALHSEATEGDQVFIYYAGHGYENERTGVGYWLPSDASTSSAKNWMSTKDLARLLRRIPAKNIMLVADSCYSGSFTKEQNFQGGGQIANLEELGSLRGVMAMSSGGDEPVMDGEVNSPFARALVDRMKEIASATVGDELYNKVRADVTAATPQTPQYGVISSAGYDPGADYLIRDARARIGAR